MDRLSKPWEIKRELRTHAQEEVSIDKALRESGQLVILGDPGAGKTTLLKYLSVICAEGRSETVLGFNLNSSGSPLPIFITLHAFAAEAVKRGNDYSLLDYLYTNTREHLMLNLQRGFFEIALYAKRCLVCLDGLDEIWASWQRRSVADAVKALIARFPGNRFVVTSRRVGYEEAPMDRREFVHGSILPFSEDEIRQFVRKWYAFREHDPVKLKDQSDDLIMTIEGESRIQTLARNPLLLTIIALIHRAEAHLPQERVKLYDRCVKALVDTWDEVKGLTIAEKQRPFYRKRRRLLERLAYELHIRAAKPEQVPTLREGDLEVLLVRILMEDQSLMLVNDPDSARDEARALINVARGRTGLLVEQGEGVFGFPHLTFQEYLAACDIQNRSIHSGIEAIWDTIKDHLHDPHWRQVILLLLGNLNEFDKPSTLLVEHILDAGQDDRFEPVLHRHLYLAARILGDRVNIMVDLRQRIVDALLVIIRTTLGTEQKDAFRAILWLEEDRYAIESLVELAQDSQEKPEVRRYAIETLAKLGYRNSTAEMQLNPPHDTPVNNGVRQAITEATKQLDHIDKAVEVFLSWARNSQADTMVRRIAIVAMGHLGLVEKRVADVWLRLARNRQAAFGVRRGALKVMEYVDHIEGKVAEVLRQLACDGEVVVELRRVAVGTLELLGRLGEVADVLPDIAYDPQTMAAVRRDAMGHRASVEEAVETIIRDSNGEGWVRLIGALALEQMGFTKQAVTILLSLVDPQSVVWVRFIAASGLGQMGYTEDEVTVLLDLAHHQSSDPLVRDSAYSGLKQLVGSTI